MNEKDILVEEIDKMVSNYIQSKRPAGVFIKKYLEILEI